MRLPNLVTQATFCLLTGIFCRASHAEGVQRSASPVGEYQRSRIADTSRAKLARTTDEGPVQSGEVLTRMTLMVRPSAEQRAAIQQLLAEQQDRTSPNFHKWLSPTEYAARFGVSQADAKMLTSWLRKQGFTQVRISHTGRFISFAGTAATAQSAFATEIHRVTLDGRSHFANITPASIPSAFAGVVSAIIGLDDFPAQSLHKAARPASVPQAHAETSSVSMFKPAAFAEEYDLTPLQSSGVTGKGVTIVVVGQADPNLTDLHMFQTMFNLPQSSPQVVQAVGSPDPGNGSADDVKEAALDLEWVSAVAPGASVVYDYADNAITQALIDAIDYGRGQIVSVSFGECESNITFNGDNNLPNAIDASIQAGNLMGMTIVAASGDQGAGPACPFAQTTQTTNGLGVLFPASDPNVTAVGGTEFKPVVGDTSSYVSETSWNDTGGGYLSASGGGVSSIFYAYSYESDSYFHNVLPPPSGYALRQVPDVALDASPVVEPYAIITGGQLAAIGGTSAATASFAGILSLVQQSLGNDGLSTTAGFGNANPLLYELSQQITDQAGGNTIFHDITTGNNIVPCVAGTTDCGTSGQLGYTARSGYDEVTGLGSVDASQLATWWGYLEGTPSPAVTPEGAIFPNQIINTSSDPISFTISNNGSGLLSISSIAVIGANSASFSLEMDTCGTPKQILPGSSCSVTVSFHPTGGGAQTAYLNVTFNQGYQILIAPLIVGLTGIGAAPAQSGFSSSLLDFNSSSGYGGGPIIQAADGNLYGVNASGGASVDGSSPSCPGQGAVGGGCGTIYRLTPALGSGTVLYNFTGGSDGSLPSSLIQGPDGNLYGTALQGGSSANCTAGCGTLFEMATNETSPSFVYQFASGTTANDGQNPSTLTLGADGNIYGTTLGGGANGAGTVFMFTPGSSAPTIIYSLPGGAAGSYPETLVQGSDGLFYGMTQEVSVNGTVVDYGSVFQIDTSGHYQTLFAFKNHTDSANVVKNPFHSEIVITQPSHAQGGGILPLVYATPKALVQYSDGNFYGTTAAPNSGSQRTVFRITPSGDLKTIYTFTGSATADDGGGSLYGLTLGSDGNFYGVSGDVIFNMTASGRLTSLYTVAGTPDPQPGSLLYAGYPGSGYFVGATTGITINGTAPENACTSNCGSVFEYIPPLALTAPVQVSLASASVNVNEPVTLHWQTLQAYSLTAQQCYASLSGGSGGGDWIGKQTGTLTGSVYKGSSTIKPTEPGFYTYALTCGGTLSGSATLAVYPITPSIVVSASGTSFAYGAPLTLTATVHNPSGGTLVPSGTISFSNGNTTGSSGFPVSNNLGTVALANGAASFMTTASPTSLQFGESSISFTASYSGDSNFSSGSGNAVVQISSLLFAPPHLPAGVVGRPYTATLTGASGGTPPYTYTLASGALPANLHLSPAGVISGTPSTTGFSYFSIQVQDSATPTPATAINNAQNNPLVVSINASPISLYSYLPTGTAGVAYSSGPIASGGVPPYSFQVTGALPTNLKIDATGNITGTPTIAGTSTFTIQVTDSGTPVAINSQSYTFTTLPAATLAVITTSLPDSSVGDPYSATIAVNGGVPPYTFAGLGYLTPGLKLNHTTGVILGTPTQIYNSSFTITVTDSLGTSATSSSLSLTTDAALSATPSSLPPGTIGSAYSTALSASGGNGIYNWKLLSGTLPPGMSLTSYNGVISGPPTQAGVYPFVVLVSDSQATPATASVALSITISQALTITSSPVLPPATVSSAYSATLGVAGGVPGYYWSIASGTLPANLHLDANTGVISGTPSESGPFNLAIQVTDSEATPVSLSQIICIAVSSSCPLQFVPIVPCRAADTRSLTPPELAAATSREFDLPQSPCGIPSTAAAYSLNVTVVPDHILQYLTLWPSGAVQPNVSTLNSYDGRVKANAAITAAGTNGGVSVFVSDASNVILDVDGYFVLATTASTSTLAFYPLTPCRVADTRSATAPLGGPFLAGQSIRSLPVQSSACGIPSTAAAYSLNVTALPHQTLNYLTTWPTGQPQPNVSTLNAPTGAVTANAAIVPAGTSGAVSLFVSDDADVIFDVNGYFAPVATGGLSLYTAQPCRVLDTRNSSGTFNGVLPDGVPVETSACALPAAALAYVLNATVVPPGPLVYLTLWPDGESQPNVSTLNAGDGAITSNLAIVPTTNGKVDSFSSNSTQLILDSNGYFAP